MSHYPFTETTEVNFFIPFFCKFIKKLLEPHQQEYPHQHQQLLLPLPQLLQQPLPLATTAKWTPLLLQPPTHNNNKCSGTSNSNLNTTCKCNGLPRLLLFKSRLQRHLQVYHPFHQFLPYQNDKINVFFFTYYILSLFYLLFIFFRSF